ncbi:MAG: hypothetical protein IPJ98_05475 [Bryobacterales bacterium]|nr:hypothetical protein [Bryobacterales bacterium]
MAEGPRGELYFGTRRGISLYHHGRWRHWDRTQGMEGTSVFSMEVDSQGTLWFSTQATASLPHHAAPTRQRLRRPGRRRNLGGQSRPQRPPLDHHPNRPLHARSRPLDPLPRLLRPR